MEATFGNLLVVRKVTFSRTRGQSDSIPTRLLTQSLGTLEAGALSRLDFWVAGVARLQCVEENRTLASPATIAHPRFHSVQNKGI
jgi:hypothetical protein